MNNNGHEKNISDLGVSPQWWNEYEGFRGTFLIWIKVCVTQIEKPLNEDAKK